MARAMTAVECQRFQALFPNLKVANAIVTGSVSRMYNCIAWTLGTTAVWMWPGNTVADFDRLYRHFGFVPATNGPIAVWGRSPADMTHACISGPNHGPRWESKCGADLRIQHGLGELLGSSYGRVVAFYRQGLAVDDAFTLEQSKTMKIKATTALTPARQKALREQTQAVPGHLREAFERAFAAWRETWFSGGLAISSNPATRAIGPAFDALVALGPDILPLVVERLADPENFMALQLYDAIQPNPNLVVHIDPDDRRILEGEQGRARRVVEAWFTYR